MKKNFKDSHAYRIACSMPDGLRHRLDGKEFDWERSEVVQWILSQPELAQYLFNKVSLSGAIIFDTETQTWKGRDS